MKKIIIIGCPGSGKSTFGRKLKDITKIPLYHLDMMYWNEDKTTVSRGIFTKRLNEAMNSSKWIIDGNYGNSMEMRLKACDTVFFLDYSTEICLAGIEERKDKPRSDIPWGEDDDADEEFISFINNFNLESRPKIMELLKKYSYKTVVIFNSRDEAENYLTALKGENMEPKDYIVSKIEGEYAYLKDITTENEVFIALHLLPQGVDVGSKLHFEMFSYTLVD